MGEKWTNPPVFYTLAQIKFNPIAQIQEYIPKIQDRLRRIGYPDYQPEQTVEVAIRRPEGAQPDVHPRRLKRWNFINVERTEGYILRSDALIFHSTQYEHFEDFSQKVLRGLSLAHEVIELAYIQRIGLRYLDAVIPSTDKTLADYLAPSLLGLSTNAPGQLTHTYTETVSQIDDGTLVARAVVTDGGLAMPPDLFPMTLLLPNRIGGLTGQIAVLDTDYFVEHRNKFDIDHTRDQLWASHTVIGDTFRSSVTDFAISSWK